MVKTSNEIKTEMFNCVWTSIQRIIKVNENSEIIFIPEEQVNIWDRKEMELQKEGRLENMEMVTLLNKVNEEIKSKLAEIGWKINEDGDLQKIE